ncbi:MAG: DUF885 family protein, partial [Alphaproteobacteria bacterium]|nr:DUF885 family protein [Alphaproteobacteria bacterium]
MLRLTLMMSSVALMTAGTCEARMVRTLPKGHAANTSVTQTVLEDMLALDPQFATAQGDHKYDMQISDYSAGGREAIAARRAADMARLNTINARRLTADEQVDLAILKNELASEIWHDAVLKDWQWDPQVYNNAAGDALYSIAARDFAPWDVRLKAAIARMNAIPDLLRQARANLIPAEVPLIHAQTVAKQNSGIVEIADDMLAPHRDALSPEDRAKFDAALATLKAAVTEHQKWLDTVLVPNAKGDFRLGEKLYDEKLYFSLDSPLTRPEIKTRALKAFSEVRAQMYTLSRQVLLAHDPRAALTGHPPLSLPLHPDEVQQQAAIEKALELSYKHLPDRNAMLADARKYVDDEAAFVRAHDLLSIPDAPVNIIEVPKYQQGVAGAYCDPPGPLESNLPTFFAISPIPESWSAAQATSYLREYNDYMAHDLAVHEAMPGHYVQLGHANAAHDMIRAIFYNSPFVEGWAVYAEGMMADEGYLHGDPLYKLTVLKMRLRSVTNALLDI